MNYGAGIFQFTTSQGGRPTAATIGAESRTFNSRPHKEVDRLGFVENLRGTLSIHDLTRRSTVIHSIAAVLKRLSIHDLTRRSTGVQEPNLSFLNPFNSRPHKEVDGITGSLFHAKNSFNSRPHKEVDRTCQYLVYP